MRLALLWACCGGGTAATTMPSQRRRAQQVESATGADAVVESVVHLRSDAPIGAALRSVQLFDGTESAGQAVEALAALGFRTALDLRLLAGGPESDELMSTLRDTPDALSIADR
eukprot:SAG31_NODE_1254_length_9087_cov_12.553071_9_plen_114_part_00